MQTQKERLLYWLKENRTINPIEAWSQLGIYRLGARIFDLKQTGMKIKTNKCKVRNRWGESCTVANYELIGE